jgi:hypothetical protein
MRPYLVCRFASAAGRGHFEFLYIMPLAAFWHTPAGKVPLEMVMSNTRLGPEGGNIVAAHSEELHGPAVSWKLECRYMSLKLGENRGGGENCR